MGNEILKFASTSTGTNLLTNAEYSADADRPIGNQAGVARLKLVNKVLRQTSYISKVFADYLIQQTGGDVLDDAGDAVLLAKITATFATGVPIAGILDMSVPQVPSGFMKCNGAAVSRTTYASLFQKLITDQGYTAQTFTVTVATPAVVTKTAHGFTGGERLRLTTTGTLPTGLSLLTDYFVFYIDANTFRLQTMSDILAGTFVNTSGTQSGTHSYQQSLWGLGDGSSTFNVPDLRGVFKRAWDDSRGLDVSRAIATFQRDQFQAWQLGMSTTGGGGVYYGFNRLDNNIIGGTAGTNHGILDMLSTAQGASAMAKAYSDGTNGTPRTGSETRPTNVSLMPVIKY